MFDKFIQKQINDEISKLFDKFFQMTPIAFPYFQNRIRTSLSVRGGEGSTRLSQYFSLTIHEATGRSGVIIILPYLSLISPFPSVLLLLLPLIFQNCYLPFHHDLYIWFPHSSSFSYHLFLLLAISRVIPSIVLF